MTDLSYLACKNKLNKCNVVAPGKLSLISNTNPNTGLPFTDADKETIGNQYKRICNQNEGNTYNCCMPNMVPESADEKLFVESISKIYPSAKLTYTNSKISEIIISKYKPDVFRKNGQTGWVQITPYIVCLTSNSKQVKFDNDNYKIFADIPETCLEANCESLEQELTLKHIVGDINSEINYSYVDDQSVVTSINDGNSDGVKKYAMKYKTVNNPLTHDFKRDRMLHIAAKTPYIKIANFLLALKANTNAENVDGETPIFNAIEYNRINIIDSIVKQNSMAINHKNKNGETPIFKAIKTKNKDILLYLFNKGASLIERDNNGNNLVHYSILKNPSHVVVKFLVMRGVALNEKNNKGQTPLDLVNKAIKEFKKKCEHLNPNHTVEYERLNANREIKNFDEKKYADKLLELQSILSYINKSAFIEANDYEKKNMTTNSESSPVEIQDFVCYMNPGPFDSLLTVNELTIKNVNSRDECKVKGGYTVDIPNKEDETNIDIKYHKEEEIRNIPDKDLHYRQKYAKIQRRPDYVQEIIEEETDNENSASSCGGVGDSSVVEGFSQNGERPCPLVNYTKYILVLIIIGLLAVFIKNNN